MSGESALVASSEARPRWASALVTGGTTGIGQAIVHQLAKQGTRVAICARRQDLLDQMTSALGDRVITIKADLADPGRAEAVVAEAKERLGSLELVIANAGFGINKPADRLVPKDVVAVLQLNMVAACATLTAAIPQMVEAKRGHLVGVSSIAGYRGLPATAAYSASKAGLTTFLESIRVDLFRFGIKVTDIQPGFIDTPLTKKNKFRMPLLMSADEAGSRIVRALEQERRVYAFPWPTAAGARILSMVPDWIYDRLGSRTGVNQR